MSLRCHGSNEKQEGGDKVCYHSCKNPQKSELNGVGPTHFFKENIEKPSNSKTFYYHHYDQGIL